MKIGVMGGTFDPIHIGHLVIAEEGRARFGLEKVVFVPSARPPHKTNTPHAQARDRMRMVELAIQANPALDVSDIEVRREGLSYTIDTLRSMRSLYGVETELFFIAGADAILEILTWKDPEALFAESRFLVANRPGYTLEKLVDALPELNSNGQRAIENVLLMDIPALAISSTDIRERVNEGRPFRYMVPEQVWAYIQEKGLYGQR